MSFNMAEAKARITAQTEGQEKISALSGAVKDLSAQVKRFAEQAAVGSNAAARMASEAQRAAQGTETVAKAGNLTANQMQNLGFQFQDLGIQMMQAAQSSNPIKGAFTALMQQGSQISGIMDQAGISFGDLVKKIGEVGIGFLAANPLIAAAAAIAGVAAAAIGLMTGEINKSSKVHVTWMDTALGAYDVIKSYLSDKLTAAFKYFGTSTGDVWAKVMQYTRTAVNFMIGSITLVPRALMASWAMIPSAAGDIVISAANYTIRGINALVAGAVGIINGFVGTANGILGKVGLTLPTLSAPKLAELQNSYAGAGSQLASTMLKAFTDTWGRDYVGEFAGAVSDAAQDRARQRLAAEGKKHGAHAGKAAGESFLDKFTEMRFASESKLMAWGEQFSKAVLRSIKDNAGDMSEIRSDMAKKAAERVKPMMDEAQKHYDSFGGGIDRAMGGYAESIGSVGERAFATWKRAIESTEDALVNFVMTGKLNFKDLANSIISDLVRIAIQQAIMKPLMAAIGLPFAKGGVFSGGSVVAHANGGVFPSGNVQAFASGGTVVGRPTLFPMSGGRTGLMGEAGPEAIMPLRRLPSGRLGVESAGGGGKGVSVAVNVDASGTQVQGNAGGAGQLGKAIGQAIQAEIIRQQRPGGLLAGGR